ncbi:MAG: hypothetical protein D4R73_03285 [Deltaproteobacteria bacterium]|nr:hypothetical protein [Deltaproteobacteria bacterium]TSA11726.1 MAG: hypothetical protein D4R73_03285 [Deltaproteobacteria bacterium]
MILTNLFNKLVNTHRYERLVKSSVNRRILSMISHQHISSVLVKMFYRSLDQDAAKETKEALKS